MCQDVRTAKSHSTDHMIVLWPLGRDHKERCKLCMIAIKPNGTRESFDDIEAVD